VLTGLFLLVQHLPLKMTETTNACREKKAKLLEIVSKEILEVGPTFHEDSDLFDAGLDSMAIMQLLIQIETHFGVQLRVGQLTKANFSTVNQIAALIS
jgi:acyl carrier protein